MASKEDIFKASLGILATATAFALTGGFVTPLSALTSLGIGIATNVGSEPISHLLKRGFDVIFRTPKVNEHIERAMHAAFVEALKEIEINWLKENKNVSRTDKKNIQACLKYLKNLCNQYFSTYADIHKNDIFQVIELNSLDGGVAFNNSFSVDYILEIKNQFIVSENFIDFLNAHLFERFQYYLRITIKEGKEAKNALDLLYNETFREYLINLISSTSKIEQKIDEIIKLNHPSDKSSSDELLHSMQVTLQNLLNAYQKQFLDYKNKEVEILKLNEEKEILQRQLFQQTNLKIYEKGQVKHLKIRITELESKCENLTTKNIILKHKAISANQEKINKFSLDGRSDKLLAAAAIAMKKGHFMEARILHLKSIQKKELKVGFINSSMAEEYYNLACEDYKELRYYEAYIHFKKALRIQPKNALYLNDFAAFLINMREDIKAISQLQLALKEFSVENRKLEAAIFSNLSVAYMNNGKYLIAKKFCEKSLNIERIIYGAMDHRLAISWNNLGSIYFKQEEYLSSLKCFNNAISISTKYIDSEIINTIKYYNNKGAVFIKLNENIKALNYFEKGLALGKKYLGDIHPVFIQAYNNIGSVHCSVKQYSKSNSFYFKALEIKGIYFGNENPDTAIIYSNIGINHFHNREIDDAKFYFEKSLAILLKFCPPDHPDVSLVLKNLNKTKEFSVGSGTHLRIVR